MSVQGITGGDGVGEPDARLSRRQQLEQWALRSLGTTSTQQQKRDQDRGAQGTNGQGLTHGRSAGLGAASMAGEL